MASRISLPFPMMSYRRVVYYYYYVSFQFRMLLQYICHSTFSIDTLQGIPMGLGGSIPMMLKETGASYEG